MINHYKPSELLPEVSFETRLEKISEGRVLLNLGPQHPSTHGVLRVVLEVDGEYVIGARCDLGYLHRGVEKLCEKRSYQQLIVLSDRLDYLSAMTNNLVFAMACEKLLGVDVPPRAKYIRIVISELQRIASHLVFIGTFGIDIGAFTPFLYAFGREREIILRIFEKLCGARLTYNYIRIGGVMYDIYPDFVNECREFIKKMRQALIEYDELLTYNPIFIDRTKNIGVLKQEDAINYAVTGPILRASGVKYDIRKLDNYLPYNEFEFDIPTGKNGDSWDRYFVRRCEIEESLKIIEQAIEKIPSGEVNAKVPKILKIPYNETYVRIEAPRGILGVYMISDGTDSPFRVHIRPPSFINLKILEDIVKGYKIADAIAILGSIDIVLGEVDR